MDLARARIIVTVIVRLGGVCLLLVFARDAISQISVWLQLLWDAQNRDLYFRNLSQIPLFPVLDLMPVVYCAIGLYTLLGGRWLINRILRGLDASCPSCGYSLRGVNSERCPECGVAARRER